MHRSATIRVAIAAILLTCVTSERPAAYNPYGWKWSSQQVDYYINPNNMDVPAENAVKAIQYGASAWSAQTNAAFSWYFAGYTSGDTVTNNGRNEVFFRNASKDVAIATTYFWYSGTKALDADIVFWDASYPFFTGSSGCSGGFYIEDVAAHEFGHALGLGHSSVSEATMVSGVKYCSTYKRSLEADDKVGIEALYPPSSTSYPPSVSIASPTSGTTVASGTAVTLSGAAKDPEDGDLSPKIAWSSNLSGSLGTGSTLQKTLTEGNHTITAVVTDSSGATSAASVAVAVTPSISTTSTTVSLTGSAYKVKGVQHVSLRWTTASWTKVDVFRNGIQIATLGNTGDYIDSLNKKGGGSYTYQVCEAGTSVCSNRTTVSF